MHIINFYISITVHSNQVVDREQTFKGCQVSLVQLGLGVELNIFEQSL